MVPQIYAIGVNSKYEDEFNHCPMRKSDWYIGTNEKKALEMALFIAKPHFLIDILVTEASLAMKIYVSLQAHMHCSFIRGYFGYMHLNHHGWPLLFDSSFLLREYTTHEIN